MPRAVTATAHCRPNRPALAMGLVSLLLSTQAVAQGRGPSIRGIVVDTAGRPLEGAEVELVGSQAKALTGPDGAFAFERLRNARYWIAARRVGFQRFQSSLSLRDDEQRRLTITLSPVPFELPEVTVRAEDGRYQRRMREFLWRSRATAGGRFLTRDDIDRIPAAVLGQVVIRHLPFKSSLAMDRPGGFSFGDRAGDFSESRLARRRRYRPDCPPAISLNGGAITPGLAVNDFHPDDVEALEVYREGSGLPIEYSWNESTRCGLVVVWLKAYARAGS
jgi:hypothetical protein